MTKVDQFESVFRSAIKDVFQYRDICCQSVLVVSDLEPQMAKNFLADVQKFATALDMHDVTGWKVLNGNDFTTTVDLLAIIDSVKPDLLFTYRNLHSQAWRHPHSLGEHTDVMLNKTDVPVVVLPNPHAHTAHDHAMIDTNVVMALTDHLSNSHDLVNYAVRFTENDGLLMLVHIEDDNTFTRYMDVISKIESIDTDEAREKIKHQLIKEPTEYIETVKSILAEQKLPIEIHEIVTFGHRLKQIRDYIEQYKVDLLVMDTKDEDHSAIHGLAYPLAVELRQIPLLLM